MEGSIELKSVVITGSTRGIGLCMAKEFLKKGCNVTISGRGEKLSEKIKEELLNFKDNIIYVPCDVTNKLEVESLWEKSLGKWGKIDIWINNAGQNCPYELIYNTSEEYIEKVIGTNLKGMIFGSQVASLKMIEQNSGQIWNMEGLGSNNMIQRKTILYGTTKHALTYFTKGLAKELHGTPVLIGRLSPGMMLTDFITKSPEGEQSEVMSNDSFKKVFNALGDKPETVAEFFIPRILQNKKNNGHIVWLTNGKSMYRFMISPFKKRKLI